MSRYQQNKKRKRIHFSQETIDACKDIDMASVCELCGIEVLHGNRALCPFHLEKTPSLKIYDREVHCYGCGAHADTVALYQHVHNCDFVTAIKELSAHFGIPLKYDGVDNPIGYVPLLTQKQRNLIGLVNKPVWSVVDFVDERDATDHNSKYVLTCCDEVANYVKMTQVIPNPLQKLYNDSKSSYKQLVRQKCRETLDFYFGHLRLLYDSLDNSKETGDLNLAQTYLLIIDEYEKEKKEIIEIYKQVGGHMNDVQVNVG